MSHFDTPSSGIKFKSLLGVNVHIRRDKGVPGAVALLVEEELNIYAGILGPDRGAGIAKGTVPLGGLGLLKPLYDVRCTEIAQSGFVLGLAQFYILQNLQNNSYLFPPYDFIIYYFYLFVNNFFEIL